MSPTQLLTLTFSHWMSRLSVNYRATWRLPPHDRKSITVGGARGGGLPFFHFFCTEREKRAAGEESTNRKWETKAWRHSRTQITKGEEQRKSKLGRAVRRVQLLADKAFHERAFGTLLCFLLFHPMSISRKFSAGGSWTVKERESEEKSLCSHTHWCIEGHNLLYFIFLPMFFKVFSTVAGKKAPHAMNVSLFIL